MGESFLLDVKNGNVKETLNSLWGDLLGKSLVDAVLIPQEHPSGKVIIQSFVTDPNKVKGSEPFAPFIPVNSARLISDITKVSPSKKKIAAVLRSCEIRAVVELAKLKQINLENIILIGIDCLGTYPTIRYEELKAAGQATTEDFLKNMGEARVEDGIRDACQVCIYPIPVFSDLSIGFLGMNEKGGFLIQAGSEKGEEIISKLGLEKISDLSGRKEAVDKLLEERRQKKEEIFKETQEEVSGIENLLSFFALCINCHNCRGVCPICYCKECFLDSPTFEFEADKYFLWAEKAGSIKMPTDSLLFHLTRMVHMGSSCVGCGLCQDACPKDIPLGKLFPLIGSRVQGIFEYVPGKSLDDELPLSTFREDELKDIG